MGKLSSTQLVLGDTSCTTKKNICKKQMKSFNMGLSNTSTQPAFACSKLAIETLEQNVKFVINKDTRTRTLQ